MNTCKIKNFLGTLGAIAIYSSTAYATEWTWCKNRPGTEANGCKEWKDRPGESQRECDEYYPGEAYAVDNNGQEWPERDYICKRPTADEGGRDDGYQARCTVADRDTCQPGAGGDLPNSSGENDVPRGAWYQMEPPNSFDAIVRCVCGCMPANTRILTSHGYVTIGSSSENANSVPVVLVLPKLSNQVPEGLSMPLRQNHFTKGPEEKPISHITLSDGNMIELTEGHPVLIKDGLTFKMIQAKFLKIGDALFTENQDSASVVSLSTRSPIGKEPVFNLDTMETSAFKHLIIANGIKIGDLVWQRKLSERASRVGLLLSNHTFMERNAK